MPKEEPAQRPWDAVWQWCLSGGDGFIPTILPLNNLSLLQACTALIVHQAGRGRAINLSSGLLDLQRLAAPRQIPPGELAWKCREGNEEEASEVTDAGSQTGRELKAVLCHGDLRCRRVALQLESARTSVSRVRAGYGWCSALHPFQEKTLDLGTSQSSLG